MSAHIDDVQAEPWRYQKVTFPPEPSSRFVDTKVLQKLFSDKGGFIVAIIFAIVAIGFAIIHHFSISNTPNDPFLYIAGGVVLIGIIVVFFIFKSAQKDVQLLQTGDAVPAFLTDFTLISNTKTTHDSKGRSQKSTDYWLEGAVFFEYQNRWYNWEFKFNSDTKAKRLTKRYYAGDIVTLLVNDEILQSQKVKIYQFFNIQLQDEEDRYIDEQYFKEAINSRDVERVTFKKYIQRRYDKTFKFNTKNSMLKGIFNLLGNTVAKPSGTTDDIEYLDMLKKHADKVETDDSQDKFYELAVVPPPPRSFKTYIADEIILPDYKKSKNYWWVFILLGFGIFIPIIFEGAEEKSLLIGGAVFAIAMTLIGILVLIVTKKKRRSVFEARQQMLVNGESALGIITDIRIGRYEKYDEGVLNNVESKLKFCYMFVATGVWHQEDFIIVDESHINNLLNKYQEGDLVSVIYSEGNNYFESIPVSLLGVEFSNETIKEVPRADIVRELARTGFNF